MCCWPPVNCLLQVGILRCRAGQALEPECSRMVRPPVVDLLDEKGGADPLLRGGLLFSAPPSLLLEARLYGLWTSG